MKTIKQGDTFTTSYGSTFKRLEDNLDPVFQSERIQLTHIGHPDYHDANWKPYTFGTEQEWFKQRGLVAHEN